MMKSKALLLVFLIGLFYSAFGQSASSTGSNESKDSSGKSSKEKSSSGSNQDTKSGSNEDTNSGSNEDSNSGSNEDSNSGSNEDSNSDSNENSNAYYTDNNGDDFVYPCGNNADWNCIRHYFLNNSLQAKPPRAVQDSQPTIKLRQHVLLSNINLKVVTDIGEIRYGAVVCEAFYINTRSQNLVISLRYERINIFSENTEYIINRRALEPLCVTDFFNATYNSLALTAVIPAYPQIQMNRAAVSAFIMDPYPQLIFGSKFSDSSDEIIARTHNALIANLPSVIQAVFLTNTLSYFLAYFETYVCDFGIPYSTPMMSC